MAQWFFTIAALDGNENLQTLRFSDAGYIDDAAPPQYHDARIKSPVLINIGCNDGGLLSMFSSQGVGDIELANADGQLDFMVTYALDGRAAVLSFIDDVGVVTEYFRGTVSYLSEQSGAITVHLKSLQESLADNFPLDTYAGDNALPLGLEGTDDDIADNVKPKLYGDCRNIPAVLVNSSLPIHQASSLDNARITAVYDEGVRLINYRANGAHSISETSIAIDSGYGGMPTGAKLVFANHSIIYTVSTGLSGGVIILSPGLEVAVPDNTAIERIDFYADTTELQYDNYVVGASAALSAISVELTGGSGAIAAGEKLFFSNHPAVYEVLTDLTAGVVVLASGLRKALTVGVYARVVGNASPLLWGSFQGYLRNGLGPVGAVTCDAVSVNGSNVVHKTGDVFNLVATAAGLTVDAGSITTLNAAGTIGLYIDSLTPTRELLDKIIKSVVGYYWFDSNTLYANLLQAPAGTADFTIEDWQIKSIVRIAEGLGSNNVPMKAIHAFYDRIESTQTSFAGSVGAARRERLRNQYREKTTPDSPAAARFLDAKTLEIESLLRTRTEINAVISRVKPIIAVRRDVCDVEVAFADLPTFTMGDTGDIITPRLGYSAGRKMVVIGRALDIKKKTATLRVFG